jgi:hypothetical protein
MFENPGNYFGRFSNPFQSDSSLNLKFGQVTLAFANLFSPSLISFANRPRGGNDLLGISL